MQIYFAAMVKEAERWVKGLSKEGQFELIHSFGVLTMHVAAHAFIGPSFRGAIMNLN